LTRGLRRRPGTVASDQQVNVLGGIVGAVWKFNYGFTRLRTPEGYWLRGAWTGTWKARSGDQPHRGLPRAELNEQKIMATASTR